MHSHLLPVDILGHDSFNLPPEILMFLPYPEDEWYHIESDPIPHERILRLTRGIHLINEWWRKQNLQISYQISEHAFYLVQALPELESAIREFHKTLSPHQKIEDRYLVIGNGATQVINAALYANALYHSMKNHPPINRSVQATILYGTERLPGYLENNTLVQCFPKELLRWVQFGEHENIDRKHLLEFVATPNNPDGKILKPVTGAAYTIHDRVNHWSLFLNEDDSAVKEDTLEDDWISIFSLSKILSFSGSRVGYAFVKDPLIAHFMKYYIIITTHGLGSDSQHRCLVALRYLLDSPNKVFEYSDWIRSELKARWNILKETVLSTSLELLNSQGPNAWVKTPGNAFDYLMKKYHIEATYGDEYGATSDHARLNLLAKPNEFDEFIWRLKHL